MPDNNLIELDHIGRLCRFRAVREAKASRQRIAEIMDLIMANIKARKKT
jgi:hypothetical protein